MSPPTRPPEALTPRPRLPTVGEQFDKYSLLAKLATGGMAELFVARLSGAAGFSKTVVIKRILPHVAHDETFTRMFLDEAITCAQISHPNVCQVFELCEAQGSHFLVLEHLEGATVGDLIRRCLVSQKQINLRLAAGIIVQACDGLHAAHDQRDDKGQSIGLVHRDVSPGNLFVTVDGIVKVLDFGIAKAAWMSRKTRTGTLLGKCEYMSPEQARGGVTLDRRSDIFSLGITAWELICGRRLFRQENDYESLKAVLRAPIARPSELRAGVPEALDSAIMRALERDRDDRFHTAHAFRQAIAESLMELGGPTPMCDIAPVIRSSFADELSMQRAVLLEAHKLSEQTTPPRLRSLPPLTDEAPASTGEVTGQHLRLASLEIQSDREGEFERSRELTFRVAPSRAPSSRDGLNAEPRTPEDSLENSPCISPVAPESDASFLEADTELALPAPKMPTHSDSPLVAIPVLGPPAPRDYLDDVDSAQVAVQIASRRSRILLVPTALLCAALAATGTLLLIGKGKSDPTPKLEMSVEVAAQGARALTSPAPRSADENANARAELMAANRRQAVVTQLPKQASVPQVARPQALPDMGTMSIHSSEPGQVFLYPDKLLIGTTPLENFALAPGDYKIKVLIGPGEGEKKYFSVKVKAGENSVRTLSGWR